MDTTIAPARLVRTYRPGFLLGPLGWLNEKLSISLVHEPEFLALLFALLAGGYFLFKVRRGRFRYARPADRNHCGHRVGRRLGLCGDYR